MLRYILTLLITFSSLYSYCQNRDFLSYYNTIDSLFNNEEYDEIRSIYEDLGNTKSTFSQNDVMWFALIQAKILRETNSQKEAGELLFEKLSQVETLNDTILLVSYHVLIGDITDENGIDYLRKAIRLCPKDHPKILSKAYYHYARAYCNENSGDDQCLSYYTLSSKYAKQINDKYLLAKIYNNISAVYISNDDPKGGLRYIDSSLLVRHETKDSNLIAYGMLNKATAEHNLDKNNKKYLSTLIEAESMLTDTSDFAQLHSFYYNLAFGYEVNGQFENATNALYTSVFYLEQIDDMFEEKELLQSLMRYEVNNMKADVALAERASKTKAKEASLFKWLSIIGAVLFGFIMYILINFFKLKRKTLELDIIQSKLEGERKIQEIISEKKNEILVASLVARDEERDNISEILHNSVSALLSSANMHLKVLKEKNNISDTTKTEKLLGEVSDHIRDLSHQLVSPALRKLGLNYALKDLCDKYSNEYIQFSSKLTVLEPRLSVRMENKIFRIVEELCNNVMKHSQATHVNLKTKMLEDRFVLSIKDNGVGMDQDSILEKKSLGLSQIKSIVDYFNGDFKISSTNGTKVTLSFPVSVLYS